VRSNSNSNVNTVNGSSSSCNNNSDKCIEGSYCTGNSDSCSGVCNPTCLKCTGSSNTQCSICSPLSTRAYLGPSGNSCGGCKNFELHFLFLKV